MLITCWCFDCCGAVLTLSSDFSVSLTALPVRRLEVRKKLGGDTARTADLHWPEAYSLPYDVMWDNKMGELVGLWQPAPQRLSGHQSAGGEHLHCSSFVLCILSSLLLFPLLFSVLLN